MEIISAAITVAQTVRLVVSALRGESKLVIAARQLMHSCQLYEDCLSTLKNVLLEKQSKLSSNKEFQNSMKLIVEKIQSDTDLLNTILKVTQDIADSSNKRSLIHNALITHLQGRVEKIKSLENELSNRVQLITALMMRDIWKASTGPDQELFDIVGDVDGALFWYTYFGNEKQVAFQVFVDAFQGYLTEKFLFRKLTSFQLITLLRHTLLEEALTTACGTPEDLSTIILTTVHMRMFGTWIQRYGPMKDTLYKVCVVSNPRTGQVVPWFTKAMTREMAEKYLLFNLQKQGAAGSLRSHHLVVVRYSADPNHHFVITTKLPQKNTLDHIAVRNSPHGYTIDGESTRYATNLIDCIQWFVFDKFYNTAVGSVAQSAPVSLAKDLSLDLWEDIFNHAMAQLPQDHYQNIAQLNAAAQQTISECDDHTGASSTAVRVKKISYQCIFASSSLPTEDDDHSDVKDSMATVTAVMPNLSLTNMSPMMENSLWTTQTRMEKLIVAKYSLHQALTLFADIAVLDETAVQQIEKIVSDGISRASKN